MRLSRIVLAAVALAACSSPREAPPATADVIKWMAQPGALSVAEDGGSLLHVDLWAEVAPGWKLYSLTQKGDGPVPMTVKLDPDSPYSIEGPVNGPPPSREMDPNFDIETETHTGAAQFTLTVRVPTGADISKPIDLKVRSQACSDRLCLPPRTTTVSIPAEAATI